jgi:hypothetical protein
MCSITSWFYKTQMKQSKERGANHFYKKKKKLLQQRKINFRFKLTFPKNIMCCIVCVVMQSEQCVSSHEIKGYSLIRCPFCTWQTRLFVFIVLAHQKNIPHVDTSLGFDTLSCIRVKNSFSYSLMICSLQKSRKYQSLSRTRVAQWVR